MSPLSVLDLASAGVAFTAVLLGLLLAISRRTFYSTLLLALIGAVTASAMALLGFTYLAALHLALYVGATVTFLLLTMAAIGEDAREVSVRHSGWAVLAAVLLTALLVAPVAAMLSFVEVRPVPPETWSALASTVFTRYWFVVLVTLIAIASILVEVVAVARRR